MFRGSQASTVSKTQIKSFAKINWILKVLGRRPDSFHEVSTVLQTVDLADRISIELIPADRIELKTAGYEVAEGEDNLAHRAACLLKREFSVWTGARIFLEKRIPVGAGLGGGSSNAAMVLLGLNRLWDCGVAPEHLRKLAQQLGSDVPFFLLGGTVWGRSRGEQLTPLPDPPPAELVLCYPGLSMSTAEAYAMGQWAPLNAASNRLTKTRTDTKIRRFCDYAEDGRRVHVLIENDFDAPLLKRFPQLAETHRALEKAGCERVALCGSGSTVVGVPPQSQEKLVTERLCQAGVGQVFQTSTLARHQYQATLQKTGVEVFAC